MNVHRCLAALVLLLVGSFCHAATTQYYYDDLGRIVQAVRSDGAVFQYQYDANGNVLAINRISASSVSIAELTPRSGHAGSTLTISGTGFSTTPSQNTVSFNGGALGTVTAATATRLTVTIPQTAQDGPVSVTVSSTTATSAMNFTVRRPTILSFTPAGVAPGGQVTITGMNLNLVPGQTTVSVGATSTTVVSATNTKLVFTAPTVGSGVIHVNTPYGNTSSTSNLIIVPIAVGAANVVAVRAVSPGSGSTASASSPQPGKAMLFTFNAEQGQFLTVQFTSYSGTPSPAPLGYALFSPTNAMLMSGTIDTQNKSLYLPKALTTGVYVLSFSPFSGSVNLSLRIDVDPEVAIDGATTAISTDIAGQAARAYFTASAGDDVGLAVTGVSTAPSGYVSISIYAPNGDYNGQFGCAPSQLPGCQIELRDLTQTGTYSLFIGPSVSATMAFTLRATRHATSTLTIGTPQTVNLASGQYADLTFTATEGQSLAIDATSITSTPSGKPVRLTAYAANGSVVGQTLSTFWPTLNLYILPAGTYRLQLYTHDAAEASMQVRLAAADAGIVPIDNGTVSFTSTLPGQVGVGTFTATAGDSLGLAITNVTMSTFGNVLFTVYAPNGAGAVNAVNCSPSNSPGCQVELRNLPLTGAYKIIASPNVLATIGFTLRLSRHATGTLQIGTPVNVNLASGQYADLTFTTATEQAMSMDATSITSTPSGKPVRLTLYASNGSTVWQTLSSNWPTLNVISLPADTYRLHLYTHEAAEASMQVRLAAANVGPVPIDSGNVSFSGALPGQIGVGTFTATTGDDLSLAVTDVTMSLAGSIQFTVYAPNGAGAVHQFNCAPWNSPGCQVELLDLPLTGTYKIVASPAVLGIPGFTLRLSRHIVDTIVLNTPYSLTLQPGQYAWLSFTATSGQSGSVSATLLATTPSGKLIGLRVYAANGSQIGFSFSATAPSVSLSNLAAGTYKVVVITTDAAGAAMDVTLQ